MRVITTRAATTNYYNKRKKRGLRKRDRSDIQRQILNYLCHVESMPITRLHYVLQLNYSQVKRAVNYLAGLGLIIRIPLVPNNLPPRKGSGRSPQALLVITEPGKEYLQKVNDIENLMQWEKMPEWKTK